MVFGSEFLHLSEVDVERRPTRKRARYALCNDDDNSSGATRRGDRQTMSGVTAVIIIVCTIPDRPRVIRARDRSDYMCLIGFYTGVVYGDRSGSE